MDNNNAIQKLLDLAEVQELLYQECALLDRWELQQWLDLYTEDAGYFVPPTDVQGEISPKTHLYYIADDRRRMQERVTRLAKKTCHAEWPRSRTRHLVSNIRILSRTENQLQVEAAFVVYRSKDGVTDTYLGRYDYELVRADGTLKIQSKSCHLDLDGLRPQAKISIIL